MANRQIVLDTETTGLKTEDGHRIIEIGCVELVNRRFGRHFHYYINPQREIDAGALAVHGITSEFLSDKPLFSDICKELMAFIEGAELIIHNAPFDVGFLNYELMLTRQGWKPLAEVCTITDTLPMARQMHVGQRNSLDALCKRYTIDNSKRDLHGALMDANLLAQVYLAMTGGQGSLFDEPQQTYADQQQTTTISRTQRFEKIELPVQLATAEEIAEHDQYLAKMAQKGKCVWNEGINERA